MSAPRQSCDCACQAELVAELRAQVATLREGLRLALLWLPDPFEDFERLARMDPDARAQYEAIRAAYASVDPGG